jgi:hypothetical protein
MKTTTSCNGTIHRTILLPLLLSLLSFGFSPEMIYAQESIDVVYLKNGDVLRGVIVEQIPFESIKMELPGGSTITIKYSDIARMTKEKTGKTPGQVPRETQTQTQGPVQPEPYLPQRHETATAIAFGYGNSFGGLGANLATYISPTSALHIGGGWFPLSKVHEGAEDMFLVAGGARIFFAGPEDKSRTYLDLQFGMLGGEYKEFSQYQGGTLISRSKKQQVLYGPTVLFGTEVFWGEGKVGGRISGGGSYNLAKIDWTEVKFLWALDVGLVFKL